MSYFDHLRDRTLNPISTVDGRGTGYLAIVGESFHRRQLASITDGRLGETRVQALLVRDPGNHYDPNCVAVYSLGGGLMGHLSRANARRFSRPLDRLGRPVLVDAVIHHDALDRDFNVVLRVDYDLLSGRR